MHATLHDIGELSPAQIQRWQTLLRTNSAVRSPFLSYEFCRAVHDVRGGVFVLHIQDENDTEGFLPFQIRRGRALLGHAEKVGGSLSDCFGIVGNLRAMLNADDLLRAAKLTSLRFDHAIGAMCPFDFEEAEQAFGVRVHVQDFDQFKDALLRANKEFVKSVLRGEKRIATDHGKLEFAWKAIESRAALNHLIEIKREQYRKTGVKDGLASRWRRDVLARLLDGPDSPSCQAIVSTLHCGGKWVASNLGLICEDTLHIWYPAYDPDFRRYGPGHLLFFKMIERGCSNGIRVFDFGEGRSSYKAEYKGEDYELWKGVLRGRSLKGQSERLLQSVEWKVDSLLSAASRIRARQSS